MSNAAIAVAARDLGYSYGDRVALEDVGFEIRTSEIFGFLGPNGGGKTTLFRLLSTSLRLQRGAAQLFGANLVTQPAEVRRQLGVVFQRPSLDGHLTVAENLIHHGRLYGLTGAEIDERSASILERLGLIRRADDHVKNLSGGLQRRVEIAKAMLHRPKVLLLDEPSTGLDPRARRDVWSLLGELRRTDGTTVLLTTHFMEEADRCDRLILLDRGRVVAEGEPERMKQEIGGSVVVLRSGEPLQLARELAESLALEPVVHGDALRFEHSNALDIAATIAARFGDRIESLTISKPTLEDVFMRSTGHALWEGDD